MKVNTIDVPFTQLKYIVHTADFHVRLVKRHIEFREVFEQFVADIRELDTNNTVIVLAGDFTHSKLDMSPELISMLSEFLSNVADVAPTILILGNHDVNLQNSHRLDALTPIVDTLNHPNLHYLKESGIYQVADTQFGVFSILGDKEDWPSADKLNSDNKIALFHGPMNNAKTDTGFTITNRHVTPTIFSGYDMALLGDIHLRQNIQEYDPNLGHPIISYPGSLIQQNHGESLKGHGFLYWDVPNRSFEFHEVKNRYGFYTITVNDSTIPEMIDAPEFISLRMLTNNTDITTLKKLQASLRKDHNIVELSVNRLPGVVSGSKSSATLNDFSEIHQVAKQNQLIRSYIKHHFPHVKKNVLDKIDSLNNTINSKINTEEFAKNIQWKPIHLTFSNMFNYGKDNEIHFDEMNGTYGLFSQNATGKSSAFSILMFCLFDKTPKAFKATHIMNNRKNDFECYLKFEIDGIIYCIRRKATRNKKGDVKVDVDFWKEDIDGTVISLNGEDRRDTDANIRSYVGSYDDFILTNISVQGNDALFIDKSQSERKDLLGQFMGLTIFDKIYNTALDEMKEVAGAMKQFNKSNFSQVLADTQQNLEKISKSYTDLEKTLKSKKKEADVISIEIRELYGSKIPLNIGEKNLEKLEQKYEKAQQSFKSIESKYKIKKNELSKLLNDIDSVFEIISVMNHDKLKQDFAELIELKKLYNSDNNELSVFGTSLQIKKDILQKLEEYEYDPNCKFCVNNVFVKDAQKIKNEIQTVQREYDDWIVELTELCSKIQKLSHVEDEYILCETEKSRLNSYNYDKLQLEAEITGIEIEKQTISQSIKESSQAINQYHEHEATIEKNQEIQSNIDNQQSILNVLHSDIQKIETNIRNLYGELQVLRKEKGELLNSINKVEDLEETYYAYEYYVQSISRDGVPYDLISRIIPTIENEINNILTQIVDFTIQLEVDGKNINGKIVYDIDKVWPLELSSGMERFISSIAIRVALMNISNLPKSNFIAVDEGFGALDSDNLTSMNLLFNILKSYFDFVIIISHLDTMRDVVDHLIEIKIDNGFSFIKA